MEDKKAGRFGFDRLASENRFFRFLRQISMPLCRISFFVVFFWFGALKILELSPAEGVVHTLYEHTVPWIPWKIFIFGFGAYECIIGIIFLFPGMEKWALYMLIPHMITTFGPLVIIALAIFIAASVWEGKNNVNAQKEEEEKRKAMKRA